MKILQIHNKYLQYGGEDAVVENEFKLLKAHGHFVRQVFFENTSVKLTRMFSNSRAYALVKGEILDFKPDVIHVHNIFYNASPSVLRAAKHQGIPVIMTLHNYRLLCTGALFLRESSVCTKCKDLLFPYYGIKYKCFQGSLPKSIALSIFIGWQKMVHTWQNHVDKFIVLTPFIKDLLYTSSLQLPEDKFFVKPNSTDDALEIYPDCEKREGFVFIGRLSEEKGIHQLIKAFNNAPNLKLSIIGNGELEKELKKTAKENIIYYGKKDRKFIFGMLKKSKALIFPSICYEGLPNTIIEAFSSGTPVIASNIENLNQIIDNGINGLLFEPGNPESLLSAVMKIQRWDSTALEVSARKTYETKYSHEDNFNNLIALYKSLT